MAYILLCKGKKDFRLTYVCGQINAYVKKWNETEKWAQLSALLKPGYWLLRLILTYDRIFVLLTYFYVDSCEEKMFVSVLVSYFVFHSK